MLRQPPVSEVVRSRIEKIVRERLKGVKLRKVDIHPDVNHLGDSIIQVEIEIAHDPKPIETTPFLDLLTVIRDSARDLSDIDDRPIYTRNHFHENQRVVSRP